MKANVVLGTPRCDDLRAAGTEFTEINWLLDLPLDFDVFDVFHVLMYFIILDYPVHVLEGRSGLL